MTRLLCVFGVHDWVLHHYARVGYWFECGRCGVHR